RRRTRDGPADAAGPSAPLGVLLAEALAASGRAAGAAARRVPRRLRRVARRAPHFVALDLELPYVHDRAHLDVRQLPDDLLARRAVSPHSRVHARVGRGRHAHLCGSRFPPRLLHGPAGRQANAGPVLRDGASASLVELPRPAVRVADHPRPQRRDQLGAQRTGPPGSEPRLHEHRDVDRLHVRLAAVHGPADLRSARANTGLVPRGLRRSRCARLADVPLGGPAAGATRRRGGIDLHVRTDARRLHHAGAHRRHELGHDRNDRLPKLLHQSPVRRGLCSDPDGHHGRLPADRPTAGSVRGLVTGRGTRISLAVWSVLVIAFLWIPLAIIALYAFNGSTIQGWPIASWTTQDRKSVV